MRPYTAAPPNQSGLSLIELMISMAIGLVLVATIGYAYIGAKQSFRAQDAMSRIQENTRYGFEFMAMDLRMVGSTGGARDGGTSVIDTANLPAAVPSTFVDLFAQPLIGYNDTAPPTVTNCTTACTPANVNPAACRVQGDAVTVLYADNETEYRATAHAAPNISLTSAAGLATGDILVASDFAHAALFQATDDTDIAGNTVSYDMGGSVMPGNTDNGTGAVVLGSFDPAINALRLYKLHAASYYIGCNPSRLPALYRRILGSAANDATATNEELLEGVNDLQIEYGVDLTDPMDRSVDAYWTSAEVSAGTKAGVNMPVSSTTLQQRWRRVLSVRIELEMISPTTGVSTRSDGRLHKRSTHVVTIRNGQWDPTWTP